MGAEGEGGTNWESSPETSITVCKTRQLVEISVWLKKQMTT